MCVRVARAGVATGWVTSRWLAAGRVTSSCVTSSCVTARMLARIVTACLSRQLRTLLVRTLLVRTLLCPQLLGGDLLLTGQHRQQPEVVVSILFAQGQEDPTLATQGRRDRFLDRRKVVLQQPVPHELAGHRDLDLALVEADEHQRAEPGLELLPTDTGQDLLEQRVHRYAIPVRTWIQGVVGTIPHGDRSGRVEGQLNGPASSLM
jgi:hypothetical protein